MQQNVTFVKKRSGKYRGVAHSICNLRTFSVPIEKEVANIDKDGNESVIILQNKIY